ncbi:DNA-binding response regulator [Candidatus Marinarcus aquaticus]|uniref:DNA-binding response regulator n=2 Tax=Candidatus Marinarcus aquaticus TaxID=2044504 RepID=A0A4Q0XLU8_9BACT|nr:DNA-binding response regulator [Candidatus Marinarcus aquaticus]
MIEDDLELADIITRYLSSFDIEVTNTDSPYTGLSMISTEKKYKLLILDLTLPEIDGLELIPKIRAVSSIPIIITSARDDILDKVMGLERGADDYLPKPYNPRELSARIKAILKRMQPVETTSDESNTVFTLKTDDMQILFQGKALELTMAEFDILKLLIQRKGGVVSREDFIYDSFHIEDDSSLKNIDVMISRIRTKLSKIDDSQTYIKSVRGIGYQLIQ